MLVSLFLFSLSLWALEVTTIGEGGTRQAAINNAIRNAVEKALGTYITSYSQVNQGELIYDRITSASAGYVKSYKILAESHDPVTDTYKIKLIAVVDDIKLKNAVEEFMQSSQFQRTFQQTKFDEKRVVVIYKPGTGLDLPYNSEAVQSMMDLIEDKLAGYGFRVFLPDQLRRIRGRAVEMVVDKKTAIEIARQEAGDVVVVVSFDAGKRPALDGYYIIYATLTLKAYDATTGELFANVQERGKIITYGNEYKLADGVARIIIKIGPHCVDKLTKKIVTRFSGSWAKFVVLIFRDVSPWEQDKIEDILDKIGWRYRISRQTGSYMEIEVFSEADPTSVRKIVYKRLKTAGLSLIPAEMAGSRIIFEGTHSGLGEGY